MWPDGWCVSGVYLVCIWCVSGVYLVCIGSELTLSPNAPHRENHDHFHRRILNAEYRTEESIYIAKRKELLMRSDSDADWEWLECWNIGICNYVVFAILIVSCRTVSDFL